MALIGFVECFLIFLIFFFGNMLTQHLERKYGSIGLNPERYPEAGSPDEDGEGDSFVNSAMFLDME